MKILRLLMLGLAAMVMHEAVGQTQEIASTASVAGQAQEDPIASAIRASSANFAAAFNAGKVGELAGMFLPKGELIDEQGTIYQGQSEIQDILKAVFERFPEIKMTMDIDSIRIVGPVAIEEGTRTLTTKDGLDHSQFRYIAVWGKVDNVWKLASSRDVADDPIPTANDFLQPLAWLVGDWINEGADGRVAITFRWSDDKNFILGDFKIASSTNASGSSTQRIGWDASTGKIRSWLFDSDGGFSEGAWTVLEDSFVIKSSSVNPDGSSASATLTLSQVDKDHFTFAGTDRIVGDRLEPDFELTVTRRLPTVTQ